MSIRHLIPLALLGLGLSLSACKDDDDTGNPEGDTDTDSDSDTDTDSDTDSDTDADMNLTALADDAASSIYQGDWVLDMDGTAHLTYGEDGVTLEGEITYFTSDSGATLCDNTLALTGTEYTGECDDCDWAYSVEATVTAEDGTDECYMYTPFVFTDDTGRYFDFMMAYWDYYSYTYYWYGYPYYFNYDNRFASGFGLDYSAYGYGVYPGPYWRNISYVDSEYGTFTRDGQLDFSWTFDYTQSQYESAYYEYCGNAVYNYATGAYDGQADQGEIDCEAGVLDVWTFDANDGDDITITVDTVADATTFDPAFWVNDPEGCTITGADDTFDCTFPPPEYQCPAALIRDAVAGTYEVVIYNYSCVDTTGAYEIRVGLE